MKGKIFVVICALAITISECSTSKKVSTGSSATQPVQSSPPSAPVTVAPPPSAMDTAIGIGRTVFETNCDRCHDQPKPADYNTAEWSDIMIKMSRKAHLTESDTKAVLTYLGTVAKQ